MASSMFAWPRCHESFGHGKNAVEAHKKRVINIAKKSNANKRNL